MEDIITPKLEKKREMAKNGATGDTITHDDRYIDDEQYKEIL
jgi:hypothetical protein